MTDEPYVYEPTLADVRAATTVLRDFMFKKMPRGTNPNWQHIASEILRATDPLRPVPEMKHSYPVVLFFANEDDCQEFIKAASEVLGDKVGTHIP